MFTFHLFILAALFLVLCSASPIVRQEESIQDAHSPFRTSRVVSGFLHSSELLETNRSFISNQRAPRSKRIVSLQPLPLLKGQDGYAETGGPVIKLFKRFSVRETENKDNSSESGSGIESDIEEIIEELESCFPGKAVVNVENVGWVPMRSLRTGDRVLQASGDYSEVFGFSHRLETSLHSFRKLCTSSKCITASHGHYIYTKGKLVAAGTIKVGDFLATGRDEYEAVTSSENVWEQGLYNPHTLTGELVVEGFRASCYTMAVRPDLAKTLLSPLRAAFRLVGADVSAGMLASVRHPGAFLSVIFGQSALAL